MYKAVLSLACAALVSGCVAVESIPRLNINGELTRSDGIIYYLPKTLLDLTVTPFADDAGLAYYQLEATSQHVPDLDDRLTLHYTANAFFDDRICAATEDGLLKSVHVATDDRTPEILISIARLAGRLLSNPFASGQPAAQARSKRIAELPFKMTIDPYDRQDWELFASAAGRHFGRSKFRLTIPDIATLSEDGGDTCGGDEICYRAAVKVPIELDTPRGRALAYTTIISKRDLGRVSAQRAFLVEKISLFEFDKGVLKGMAIKKPSEALAAAGLPLTLIDAVLTSVLSAPANALGRAFGGLTEPERKLLLAEIKDSAAAAKTAQSDLDAFRNVGIETLQDESIKFTCSIAGNGASNN